MSRLSGNLGSAAVQQTTTAKATAEAGGFKGFMMAIGKGLSRAGQDITHFFGTSVPNFFKSLGQRNATQITTNDQPRSMTLDAEEKSDGTSAMGSEYKLGDATATKTEARISTKAETKASAAKTGSDVKTSGPAFAKSAPLGNIDWSGAKAFDVKDSGHGGVVLVEVGGAKAVVKGGGVQSAYEVLGARLARELGLPAPETRMLSKEEKTEIKQQMDLLRAKMPARSANTEATVVMEFVEGKKLGEEKAVTKQDVKQLAQSLGKWLAFDAVISEQDRFASINGMGNGINTGNFLVNPKKPGEIIGIDQNVMAVDTSKTMKSIMNGEDFFFVGVGKTLADYFPALRLDFEALGDEVKQSTQQMFKQIGTTLTDAKIAELSGDLTIDADISEALSQRCGVAHNYALT
jgi:hypothetical protein